MFYSIKIVSLQICLSKNRVSISAIQKKKQLTRSYIHSGSFALSGSNLVIKNLLIRVSSNWSLLEIACKKKPKIPHKVFSRCLSNLLAKFRAIRHIRILHKFSQRRDPRVRTKSFVFGSKGLCNLLMGWKSCIRKCKFQSLLRRKNYKRKEFKCVFREMRSLVWMTMRKVYFLSWQKTFLEREIRN